MRVQAYCYHAGGAELISSWIRREGAGWTAVLFGPAKDIFYRKLGKMPLLAVDPVDLVICGSGAPPKAVEYLGWRMARHQGRRTAVFLDHWKNYTPRFIGVDSLPDEVWVADRFAADLARRELPTANVVIKGNPYVDEMSAAVRSRSPRDGYDGMHILYVAEPRRRSPRVEELVEIAPAGYVYRMRPHPSQERSSRTLVDDLVWADIVVGYDTMALAVALRCGCRVVSLLESDEDLHIPWTGIERFYG